MDSDTAHGAILEGVVESGDLIGEVTVDVDGVEIIEQAEEYGFSWSWDDPRGFQSEILWNREAGSCNLGTRMLPGGWVHTHLDSAVWGTARTIYEAREVVGRYVFQAAARPA